MAVTHSSYMRNTFLNREEVIQQALQGMKTAPKCDAIVCTGVSGMVVAPIISYMLDKQLIVVRKPNYRDCSHADLLVEGCLIEPFTYVIMDDFCYTGDTVKYCLDALQLANHKANCLGLVSYALGHSPPPFISLYEILWCSTDNRYKFNNCGM